MKMLIAKMEAEGLSEAAKGAFLNNYKKLVAGETGMVPESSINPVDSLPKLADMKVDLKTELLGQTVAAVCVNACVSEEWCVGALQVILKLNGGLGTGMGLDKAKSLVTVKDGHNVSSVTVCMKQL